MPRLASFEACYAPPLRAIVVNPTMMSRNETSGPAGTTSKLDAKPLALNAALLVGLGSPTLLPIFIVALSRMEQIACLRQI